MTYDTILSAIVNPVVPDNMGTHFFLAPADG